MHKVKFALAASMFSSVPLYAADIRMPDAPPEASKVGERDAEVKAACTQAITGWAKQFDPIKVDTIVTGSISNEGPERTALLDVTIDYNRQGGVETRSARIECTLGENGEVDVKESAE